MNVGFGANHSELRGRPKLYRRHLQHLPSLPLVFMNSATATIAGIQVVAFDCDGVLFDTRRANRRYYNRILAHLERPPMTEKQFSFVHMHTVDNSLAYLFPDPAERQRAHAFRSRMGYGPFLPYMEIEPTLRGLLASLRPRYQTAVATNRTNTMAPLLKTFDLENAFDLVVCASDVPMPKPHPDVLLRVLSHFRVEPDQLVYVGDSKLDEEAAAAAGVTFVAYGDEKLNGAYRIRRLAELSALLDGAGGQGPSSREST